MQYFTIQILRSILYGENGRIFVTFQAAQQRTERDDLDSCLMRGLGVWTAHANRIPHPAGRFIHFLNGRVRRTDRPHLRSSTICLNRIYENPTTKEKETGICGVIKTTDEI